MTAEKKQEPETTNKRNRKYDYSICRTSCSICPYRQGLLKLLDHGHTIVPSLPESEQQNDIPA